MRQAYYADRISPNRSKTPEGFLIALGVPLSRTGWQTYTARELQIENLNPDTRINVYRDAADVFDPASMASFEGKSLTMNHPEQFLTPNNDREHAIGHVSNVRRGGRLPDGEEAVIGDVVVKDAQAIQYIQDGVRDQLSAGYTYNLIPMSGGDDTEPRLQMKDIRGNHLALVTVGRAGKHVRVLDAGLEEGATMLKEELDAVGGFFKNLGLRLVTARDAESETVKTQEEKDKEALELKQRTMDAEAEAEEKKDKEEKKATDKAILDALVGLGKTMKDGFEELAKKEEEPKDKPKGAEDAKCTCDAEEGAAHKEACPMFKKAEDADLIPVATLPKEDRPKNPIPGADSALANLRSIKADIAATGDKKIIDAYNGAVKALKTGDKVGMDNAYAILNDVKSVDPNGNRYATDAKASEAKVGAEFEALCKKFHRNSVGSIQ